MTESNMHTESDQSLRSAQQVSNTPPDTCVHCRRRLNLCIPVLLVVIAGVFVAMIWRDRETGSEQRRNIQTFIAIAVPSLFLFLWTIFLAPMGVRLRKGVAIGGLTLVILAAILYKIDGFDGDMQPIIRPRWWGKGKELVQPVVLSDLDKKMLPPSSPPPGPVLPQTTPSTPTTDPSEPVALSADFPQFLGPARNGIIAPLVLHRDWSTKPPIERWRHDVGPAWSAFSVQSNRAITQEQRGSEEWVICYDLTTGRPLWTHRDTARYDTTIAGIGPRASPTITDTRVITLGATGLLNCLDLATGHRLWSVDIIADNDAAVLEWGMAGSPLVDGDRVIISAGGKRGSVTAYNLTTGSRLWSAGNEATNYASPVIFTLLGERHLIIQNNFTITGHDPKDGRVLWSHPTPGAHPKVAQALRISDNRLLISSGYGTGSNCFELERQTDGTITTRSIWKNILLKSKFANMVQRDGYVYGLNDGTITCLNLADGERAWRGLRVGHGQLLITGDLLLITSESGEVILAKATHEQYVELSRFRAFTDKTWNSPALAGRFLLVRNDREAACFELPME